MLQFNNSEVAEKFESLEETDRPVHKAGVYSGLLSNINPAMAEAMLSQKSNLIKAKEPVKAATAKAEPATGQAGSAAKAVKPAQTEGN